MACDSKMETKPIIIRFYGHNTAKPFYYLSNFSNHSVLIDGVEWPTTEHYFQAMKFEGISEVVNRIRQAKTPAIAKAFGSSKSLPIREDWEKIKQKVMEKALLCKFRQHPDICRGLIETGDAVLVEHTIKDGYWGDAGNGTGANHLGKLLMKVRDLLKQDAVESQVLETIPTLSIETTLDQQEINPTHKRKLEDQEFICSLCKTRVELDKEIETSVKRLNLPLNLSSSAKKLKKEVQEALSNDSYICQNCLKKLQQNE
jgi:N-glycosidase YbiA